MPVELDNRRVVDCPFRRIDNIGRSHGRHSRVACCSQPDHGGLCGYDGKEALWKCKFGHAAKGQ